MTNTLMYMKMRHSIDLLAKILNFLPESIFLSLLGPFIFIIFDRSVKISTSENEVEV